MSFTFSPRRIMTQAVVLVLSSVNCAVSTSLSSRVARVSFIQAAARPPGIVTRSVGEQE